MKKILLSALIGALLAGGGVAAYYNNPNWLIGEKSRKGDAAQFTLLSDAQKQSGEIRKDSQINYADGSRSTLYRLNAQKGDAYDIQAQGALNSRISIFRDGYLLAASTDQSVFCGNGMSIPSLLQKSRLLFQADNTGDYIVAVSGNGPHAFGPFEVQTQKLESLAETPSILALDKTIEDWGLGKSREYEFKVETSGLYTFELNSCDFDGLLKLEGAGVEYSDDDGGNGYDPKLEAWLEAGTYKITATSAGDAIQGQFKIKASQKQLPDGVTLQMSGEINPGQAISGILANGATPIYHFTLTQATQVSVLLSSDSFDPYMTLNGAGQSFMDDDSGGGPRGTNAMISEHLPAGEYSVVVAGYGQGIYTLTLNLGSTQAN